MLRVMAKAGISELDILGGEPTIYPHIESLIDNALQNNIKVFLSTNGSDTNILKNIISKNRNPSRDFLNIGISINDAQLTKELYDFILCHKPFLKSVITRELVLPDAVKPLLQNHDLRHYLLFMDVIKNSDLDISLSFPEYFGILEKLQKKFPNIGAVYCEGFIPSSTGELNQIRCPAGTDKISVMPDGSIYPCYLFFSDENYKLGNILDNDLEKILRSPILDFFKRFKGNKCPVTNCKIYNRCRGGCPAVSLLITGDIESPEPRCLYRYEQTV